MDKNLENKNERKNQKNQKVNKRQTSGNTDQGKKK